MSELNSKELIRIGAILNSCFDSGILSKEFPSYLEWYRKQSPELIQEVITEETLKIDLKTLSIQRNDFLELYIHASALLGTKEFNHRFPGLRLLLLNTCKPEEFDAIIMKIEQVKKNFMNF